MKTFIIEVRSNLIVRALGECQEVDESGRLLICNWDKENECFETVAMLKEWNFCIEDESLEKNEKSSQV